MTKVNPCDFVVLVPIQPAIEDFQKIHTVCEQYGKLDDTYGFAKIYLMGSNITVYLEYAEDGHVLDADVKILLPLIDEDTGTELTLQQISDIAESMYAKLLRGVFI